MLSFAVFPSRSWSCSSSVWGFFVFSHVGLEVVKSLSLVIFKALSLSLDSQDAYSHYKDLICQGCVCFAFSFGWNWLHKGEWHFPCGFHILSRSILLNFYLVMLAWGVNAFFFKSVFYFSPDLGNFLFYWLGFFCFGFYFFPLIYISMLPSILNVNLLS